MHRPSVHLPSATNPPQAPELLTVADFQRRFKPSIGINTVYRLVHEGRIRSIRLGERKILIPASELTAWPQRELEAVC